MTVLETAAAWITPAVAVLILTIGLIKRGKVYDEFITGATEGLKVLVKISPPIIAMFVAIGVLRASGLIDAFAKLCSPVFTGLGIPPELTGFAVIRPLSGSGALAELSAIFTKYGPDSLPGLTASVMMGCTETVFYTLSIYSSAAGLKKTGRAVAAGVAASLAAVLSAAWITRLL